MTTATDRVKYDHNGLVPVIAQDAATGDVLTLAYANREALEETLSSGEAHYYSRSRSELWRKGATSGNTQGVVEVVVAALSDERLSEEAADLLYHLLVLLEERGVGIEDVAKVLHDRHG